MKGKRGLPFVVIGLLLIAAALSLSGYNIWDEKRAAESVELAIEEILPLIPDPKERPVTENPSDVYIPDYILNPEMDMPAVKVREYDYIGYLSIPALGLRLPVMSQWSYPLLKVAPCRYTGTAYQNDLVIAAHNYRQHFGSLPDLRVGDEISFTDIDGNVFRYVVAEMEELAPDHTREMVKSGWDLTLFTCNLSGTLRFTVRCSQVDGA